MFKRDAEEHYFGSMVEPVSNRIHKESTMVGSILVKRKESKRSQARLS